MLLTRSPLYSPPEGSFLVRLACVKRAASVDSEPGSNSRVKYCLLSSPRSAKDNSWSSRYDSELEIRRSQSFTSNQIVKDLDHERSSLRCPRAKEIPSATGLKLVLTTSDPEGIATQGTTRPSRCQGWMLGANQLPNQLRLGDTVPLHPYEV